MNNPINKYGLIAGGSTVLAFLLVYFINKAWMVNYLLYYGTLLIYLLAMVMAVRSQRTLQGDALTFREGLRVAFAVFVIANALFYVFYYLIHQIDPSLAVMQKEAMREMLPKVMPKDELARALEELEKTDMRETLSTVFMGFARGAMGGFILSLIIAYIYKTESPKL
jgi:hypothetical protein